MTQREIKFRAWDKDLGRMFILGSLSELIADQKAFSDEAWFANEDKAILMQFTGLKDKNGKEIYEGDIVIEDRNDSKPHQISFKDGAFTFAYKSPYDGILYHAESNYLKVCHEKMKVIGNIYENPELL